MIAQPLGNRVVIKQDEVHRKVDDILLPDQVMDAMRPQTGVVLRVGDECKVLQVGDKVLFSKYGGHEFQEDKDKEDSFVLIHQEDKIYCRLNDE